MRKKFALLFIANLILLGIVFFLLHSFNIIEIPSLHVGDDSPPVNSNAISDDPFLMEKEALKKQWAVLAAKETDLEQRLLEMDKANALLTEKQKEINKQLESIENTERERQSVEQANNQDEQSIRNLAQKISSIPPQAGAEILNDMEPAIAVEVIQMMDKIAQEQETTSISAYLISLMDPERRKEVVRLLSAYPSALGQLNIPSID